MRKKQKQAPHDKSSPEEDEEKRNEQTTKILERVKEWLEVADEDEEIFNQQYNNFKSIIEELDANALEEFWICLYHNRAEVKRKKILRMNEEKNTSRGTKALCYKFR